MCVFTDSVSNSESDRYDKMSVLVGWHFFCPIGACSDEKKYKFKYKVMIRPLADRVVIEPKAAETQTASGLYIPDTAKEKPQQGTVVAAGPGKKDEPMEVKVGDVVIYGKYAGTEVTVEGKEYLIMKQSDILAVL